MCGIVGIARVKGERPIEQSSVEQMCDAISHRGPDDAGFYFDAHVGLGMRRLSIIDLTGGHQPIFNEDGTKVVVMNGEIYNYRELRRELTARGHVFRTESDTETIVHLYEDFGAECVTRLRGMFAFAVWDQTKRRLVIARDRFGIKPLYVSVSDQQIAFASELKALLAVGLTNRTLDWNALDAYFRLGYIPAPYTAFTDVRKLEPGHVLVWTEDGAFSDEQYWDVPVAERDTPGHVTERILEWLDESVSAHMVSDVPVAAMLSGGLDSSAVVSSMAMAGYTPHAYTARYHGSGAEASDESGLAAMLTARYGAKLTIVDVEPRVADLMEPIVGALDEPHADESAIPTWLISERIAQDYKVVLAGTGGDELFAGYRRHFGLLYSDRYTRMPAVMRSAFSRVVHKLPEPRDANLGVNRLKRFAATAPGSVASRYLSMLHKLPSDSGWSLFAPAIQDSMRGSVAEELFETLHVQGGRPNGVRAAQYFDYKTYLPDDILHVSDRISMAHSLEVRVPFVDHLFVQNAFPLADHVKAGRGRPKHLLRRALKSRLPDAHFRAPKRGFVGPTASWLRNELRDMVLDELSPSRWRNLGYFNTDVLARLIHDHMTGRHNRESALWALLSFSIWHRLYCESGSVRPGELRAVTV